MLDRTRTALVESYAGVIVVGWLLADGLVRFAEMFAAPVLSRVSQLEWRAFLSSPLNQSFPYQAALPDAISAVLLLLIGYGLLRWLYYPRAEGRASSAAEEAES